MNKCLVIALCAFALGAAPSTARASELEDRAIAFDAWANTYHFTPYGGIGYAYFTTPTSTELESFSISDSTIWTGTYLAAEAFRYAETGDPEAKANAIRSVQALDHHLQVTGVPGFIARSVAPYSAPWNSRYIGHDRVVHGTGEWQGDFWLNNTSRDQYTGWFFGMAIAYEHIDDEPTRELIRRDVKEVVDELRKDNWIILGEDGRPTDAAPLVILHQRLASTWVAAYGPWSEEYYESYEQLYAEVESQLDLDAFSWLNKYDAYFGFNLSHENFYLLFHLDPHPDRRRRYLEVFDENIRYLVDFTHNVFFDVIYLSQCQDAGGCRNYLWHAQDVQTQIADFQDPPVREVPIEIPELPLDQISVFLSDLIDQLGIRDILDIEPQTLAPRPVKHRCPRSFMWQKTPYNLTCPGGDGTEVYPGVDYMVAYWMGRYYGLIDRP